MNHTNAKGYVRQFGLTISICIFGKKIFRESLVKLRNSENVKNVLHEIFQLLDYNISFVYKHPK